MKNRILSFVILLSITNTFLWSCQKEAVHVSTVHQILIKNEFNYPLKIIFTTIDSSGEYVLPDNYIVNGDVILNYAKIHEEILDAGLIDEPYSQEQFSSIVKSIRVFKQNEDQSFTEVFANVAYTDLSLWKIVTGNDHFFNTVQNYHEYWLNITDEIAKN